MTIQELLATPPEQLLALSDEEIKKLLAPFIPSARAALLPPENPRKLGLDRRAIADGFANMKDDMMKTLKELKERQGK
jgi:hypothetical protein